MNTNDLLTLQRFESDRKELRPLTDYEAVIYHGVPEPEEPEPMDFERDARPEA